MKTFTLAILPLALISAFSHAAEEKAVEQAEVDTVYVTAEKQLQQSLGVSRISKDDIDKRPAANDISEFVRTMPGVNLTGNTATGQRGNKRQIDLRGMGPENTLILIDGKPVNSRQSERISMRGERNTRGDSNWVPVEEIESITVLRGPAATRYGSGAMGGVVNIVTKKVSKEFKGQVNLYANQPQDSKEGATRRIGFNLSGPIIQDTLGFRIYGNLNKTDADAADINAGHGNDSAAGVEGVRNKDIAGRLQWKISPAQTLILDSSYSRQGNIYNGDTQNSNPRSALVNSLADSKAETARLYRSAYSLTHDGAWEWGDTKNVISYERTVNSHLPEGLAGGPEGSYTGLDFVQSRLKNLRFSSEANIPFKLGVDNVLTVGAEFTDSKLDDPTSNSQSLTDTIPGKPPRKVVNIFSGVSEHRSGKTSQRNWAAYVEDNISLTDKTHLIPAIRFDHNSASGSNWSPALNFSHQIGENWLVKGGIARAYKAPNLYQASSDFILYTRGQGCPLNAPNNVSCFYMGNSNLKPETSINKEIGLEFNKNSWQASATYFHNAYRNKIVIGDQLIATSNIGNWLLQWENTPKATISGIEGNLVIPLHDTLKWSNNFTYMHKSEDYQGNPLSLVPKHTINSTLSWTPNEHFDANLTFTHYGRTKPRGVAINRLERDGNPRAGITPLTSEHNQTQVGSYGIWGINAGYNWNKRVAVRGGISNLFDKKLYRTTAGAQTYNEHGRAFYGSLKVSF
ncbi:TonB-dependent siderophore receptor [Neisseria flavescens]|uniref:TonB-dependent siderophore receptor n=1 Tax=Neisseria flavescens NRL30031/H210 TaxID=546264 RepID=C0EJB5_NEIFL|nr:FepA family TonB-dependent siderophore receptor [Neisseria flavescens]SPY03805.1 transferrin-binding protein A [Neisseria meningitidis]EEG34850.1 TonB-dependent siderophore receptor [Neisseria flavescens NRL30031/H210]QCL68473.1 TonB-dependent siderophore receptor [Neisseria flavescens]SPY06153.1 transferrin-binding protein A [Neisseria meningitidis]STZ65565.1 transferrin-binding protein A [Neisseria flavescens]